MRQHYRVTSRFRDKGGRELFERETYAGVEEDAKCALVEAYPKMAAVVAADPRIDVVSSTVRGADGTTVTTSDYADELGSGVSMSGLTEEVQTYAPTEAEERAFEQAAADILTDGQDRPFGDGIEPNTDPCPSEKEVPYEEGIFPRSSIGGVRGGVDVPAGTDYAYKDADGSMDSAPRQPQRGRRGGGGTLAGASGVGSADREVARKPWATHGREPGPDPIRDITEAIEDTLLHTNQRPTHIRVSEEVMEAILRKMGKAGRADIDEVILDGVPVVKHDDPDMTGIQVVRAPRTKFAVGGYVSFNGIPIGRCENIEIEFATRGRKIAPFVERKDNDND